MNVRVRMNTNPHLDRIPQTVRLPREPPSDIQERHLEAIIPLRHLEQPLAIFQCHFVPRGISTSATHVERHAHDVEAASLGLGQQDRPVLRRRSELAGQATLTPGVIGDDPHDQLYLLAHRGALLNLRDIVERHHAHAATDGVDDVSPSLAGIGIYDLRPRHVLGEGARYLLDQCDLPPRRAVEVATEAHESPHDGGIGIALDGVVGHDAGEGRAPSRQLGRDDAEIDDVERILDGVTHARLEGRVVPTAEGGQGVGGGSNPLDPYIYIYI